MKLTCLQENLNTGLAIVSRSLSKKTFADHPWQKCVYLMAKNGRLYLQTFNSLTLTRCEIQAKVEVEGAELMPGRQFTDFVMSMPNDVVTMETVENHLQITSGRTTASFNRSLTANFPEFPLGGSNEFIVSYSKFLNCINRTSTAALKEDSRPILTGVNVSVTADTVTFAAADGFRLSIISMPIDKDNHSTCSFVLPADVISNLKTLQKSGSSDILTIKVNDVKNQVLFSFDNIELLSQLITGNYPAYQTLIPKSVRTTVKVNRTELLSALKSVKVFNSSADILRMIIDRDQIELQGRSEDNNCHSFVDCSITGSSEKFAIRTEYLIDALNMSTAKEISIGLNGPTSPCIIKEVGNSNWVCVTMPMFVQW